ncbi:MAG: hypothetical protein WD533_06940 [Dehalococcoidia bacterium]
MARKSAVELSPHEGEIRDLLRSGWPVERVREYLATKHGSEAVPPARALSRYRRRFMPPQAGLPSSMIRQAMKGLRNRVDALQTLDALIWAQEDRVGRLWMKEREEGRGDPHLDQALRTVLEYVRERVRLGKELCGDGGGGVRLERREHDVMEIPKSHLDELMAILRRRG